MIRSDTLDALNTALGEAQGEFGAVAKTASNPFFKSAYAPLPDVVKAATPILSKHGLAVWQAGDVDEAGELLWTVVLHSSGQYIGSSARLLPIKNDPQAQGSAVTYQRRYQYMAALGLVADEDDDGNAASAASRKPAAKPKPKPAPAPLSPLPLPKPVTTVAPEAVEKIGQTTLDYLREQFVASGKSHDELAWMLVSVGVTSLPADPSKADVGAAMKDLTRAQAVKLGELFEGDDTVPGSGESA